LPFERGGDDRTGRGDRVALAIPLVCSEEECLVVPDGAAGVAPELVLAQRQLARGEAVARIKIIVTEKIIKFDVLLVRP
jgi:hypothetical protein